MEALHRELDELSDEIHVMLMDDISKGKGFNNLFCKRWEQIKKRKVEIVKILHKQKKIGA